MSSMKTRDVLDRVRAFRSELSALYKRMGEQTKRERVRMLLDYMGRHEERLEHCLDEYEKIAGQGVLNTWFKFVPELADARARMIQALRPDMEFQDLLRIGLELDRDVAALYRCMAEGAVSAEVRELFSGLLKHEEREEALLARSAQELEQS